MFVIVEGNPLNIIVTQYCEQYLGVMMFYCMFGGCLHYLPDVPPP